MLNAMQEAKSANGKERKGSGLFDQGMKNVSACSFGHEVNSLAVDTDSLVGRAPKCSPEGQSRRKP